VENVSVGNMTMKSDVPNSLELNWPGRERRSPSVTDRYYLALSSLSKSLRQVIEDELVNQRDLVIVDLGCGSKPYYPWFQPYAKDYIGVDAYPGPHVDIVSPAEDIRVIPSGSIDVVLCNQVLEHVDDSQKVVSEIHRILKPSGVCFLTTHGIFVYHGQPKDYWRWTHEGLERLFTHFAGFRQVNVIPTEGIVSSIFNLITFYMYLLSDRYFFLLPLKYTVYPLINLIAGRMDLYAKWMFSDNPISINYLVVAKKEKGV
jgi:SAM-dependent methyltransferase